VGRLQKIGAGNRNKNTEALTYPMPPARPAALVTGASSGIGEVFARKLAQQGYRTILVARRKERLEKLSAEFPGSEVLAADLATDPGTRAVEARLRAESELQFLVNNAGFGVPGSFHRAPLEALDRMHRIHVIAVERLTHAALPGMINRGRGSIINVSSVAGFLTSPYSIGYCATKAWINSFTEGLYLELKSLRSAVRVQALCPGFTYTEFHDVAGMDRSRIPSKLWMSAEEVVDASLRGLERDRLFVIPGWPYRLFVAVYSRLPRSLQHLATSKRIF
jgi:uncharacterized protein